MVALSIRAHSAAGIFSGTSAGNPFVNAVWSAEASSLIPRTGAAWNNATSTNNPITNMAPAFNYVKCFQIGDDTGSAGYIYTVDPTLQIPWASVNPSYRVPYVFCFEALPAMNLVNGGYQTDFYVGRNNPSDDLVLPLNHWAQQWMAIEKVMDIQASPPRRWKWWYPCRDGHGSCHMGIYITAGEAVSGSCVSQSQSQELGYYLKTVNENWPGFNNENIVDAAGVPSGENPDNLGTSSNAGFLSWQEWVLMKWHCYTSGVAPDGGVFYNWEMWIRRYGVPAWTKIMDWRSNTKPCPTSAGNFRWRLIDQIRGQNDLRIPTTVGNASFNPPDPNHGMKFYMADLVVVLNEADLPTYAW